MDCTCNGIFCYFYLSNFIFSALCVGAYIERISSIGAYWSCLCLFLRLDFGYPIYCHVVSSIRNSRTYTRIYRTQLVLYEKGKIFILIYYSFPILFLFFYVFKNNLFLFPSKHLVFGCTRFSLLCLGGLN